MYHTTILLCYDSRVESGDGYLPPGVHKADWHEMVERFGGNPVRQELLEFLLKACRNLAAAGCTELLLDGSFVTAKPEPGDYDKAWETQGVNEHALDPAFLGDDLDGFDSARIKYKGDLFPASGAAEPGVPFRDFFQTDRDGVEKGVVLLNLRSLP